MNTTNAHWIKFTDRKPTLQDLPIWSACGDTVDLFSFSIPSDAWSHWLPADVPSPPPAPMDPAEQLGRLKGVFMGLEAALESEELSCYPSEAIQLAVARAKQICGGSL